MLAGAVGGVVGGAKFGTTLSTSTRPVPRPRARREDELGVAASRRVAERRAALPAAGGADAAGGGRNEGSGRPPLADADADLEGAGRPERCPHRQAPAGLQVVARASRARTHRLSGDSPWRTSLLKAAVLDSEPRVQSAPALQAALERSVVKVVRSTTAGTASEAARTGRVGGGGGNACGVRLLGGRSAGATRWTIPRAEEFAAPQRRATSVSSVVAQLS